MDFTGAPMALPVTAERWRVRTLATGFPFFFDPKIRTRKCLPAEESRVRLFDVHVGFTFIRAGGSCCLCQDYSRVYIWDSLGLQEPFQLRRNIGGSARWPHDSPSFLTQKKDAETSASIGGACASIGRACRIQLPQSRLQLS